MLFNHASDSEPRIQIRQGNFNEDEVKKYFFKSLGKAWANFRSSLKTLYFVKTSRAASINALEDERVDENQWEALVDYWLTEEAEKQSKRNSENRKKLKLHHTLGRKPIPVLVEQQREQGKILARSDIFIMSHTQKDGTIHESAREIVEKIQTAQEAIDASSDTGPNDLIVQILGKERPGRLRLAGFGATATNTWGSRHQDNISQEEAQNLRGELEELRAEVAEMPMLREQVAEVPILRAQIADLQAQKAQQTDIEKELKAQKEHQAEFERSMSRFVQAFRSFETHQG